ncbi:MAG: anti-sigma F factor antagonist [Hyphomonadaceae bacterium]|nr:anti-sigma F factor antagonist [Clostridia bacterium]
MALQLEKRDRSLIAFIDGELDHHCAASIRETLDSAYQQAQIKNLILDFSKLTFMDSSGIGVIIGRYKMVQAGKGKMLITGISANVLRLLTLSGIHKIIPIVNNVETALKTV